MRRIRMSIQWARRALAKSGSSAPPPPSLTPSIMRRVSASAICRSPWISCCREVAAGEELVHHVSLQTASVTGCKRDNWVADGQFGGLLVTCYAPTLKVSRETKQSKRVLSPKVDKRPLLSILLSEKVECFQKGGGALIDSAALTPESDNHSRSYRAAA